MKSQTVEEMENKPLPSYFIETFSFKAGEMHYVQINSSQCKQYTMRLHDYQEDETESTAPWLCDAGFVHLFSHSVRVHAHLG